jgi:hypothetical protein
LFPYGRSDDLTSFFAAELFRFAAQAAHKSTGFLTATAAKTNHRLRLELFRTTLRTVGDA